MNWSPPLSWYEPEAEEIIEDEEEYENALRYKWESELEEKEEYINDLLRCQ